MVDIIKCLQNVIQNSCPSLTSFDPSPSKPNSQLTQPKVSFLVETQKIHDMFMIQTTVNIHVTARNHTQVTSLVDEIVQNLLMNTPEELAYLDVNDWYTVLDEDDPKISTGIIRVECGSMGC